MFDIAQKFSLALAALMGLGEAAFADSMLAESLTNAGATLRVIKLDSSSPADLLLIDGGVRNGLRAGLRCSAFASADEKIGEVMIVEAGFAKSVALVLGDFNVVEGNFVRLGKENLK